nr:DNA-directed DNA polymerase [Tanacetum cinerariifolium]
MLPYYCYNLERKNEGSVTRIKTDDKRVFEMLFIAIGASTRTFLNYLCLLLIIDPAHLKGEYKGINLVAVGMDGNKQIVPVAFGICKRETGPCWSCLSCCMLSSSNDELIVEKENNKRFILENMQYVYTDEFTANMNIMQVVQPDAYQKLCQAGTQRWSRAHCPLVRYNYMTSNSVKSVNAYSVINRKLPVLELAETYRAMLQDWYFERQKLTANMKYEITDWVADKVHKRKLKSSTWIVHGVNQYVYQVSDGRYNCQVNLKTGVCECRKWQLSGISCGHVIAVTRFDDGMVATIDPVELESFSTRQMKLILTNCLGYDENSAMFLYIKKPSCSLDLGLIPLDDAIQDTELILTYSQTQHNRLHVYVSQVKLSPLVVADQSKDEGKLQIYAAHHPIDLSTVLIPNDGSLEKYFAEIVALKAEMAEINKNLMKVLQINQQVKAVAHNCETCGGPHSYNDCPATVGQTQNVYAAGAYNQGGNSYQPQVNTTSFLGSGTLPGNTITNLKEDLKGIATRSGNAYKGPTIPTTSSIPKILERETEVTKDTMPPTNNGSTKDVQPPVVQIETPIPNSKPVVAPIAEAVVALVSAPKPNQKLSIPYPFVDALILMPKFGPTIKSLLINKDKLFELARTPLNEHCSVILLKKLLEKVGDPGKFLIPCDFARMDECLALADLGASINIMPLSIWNKLSLLELSPMCMTLILADRSISRPVGVTEDVFVKVGAFHFPADFVVIDFDADPRVSLIPRRSFLKIGRALIDVYEGELTLRVGKEAVTFNLDQTARYSANYDAMSVNRIDLIDVACEVYSQEVLGFFVSGNPTPSTKPIVSNSSPTLTPFRDSDFLLEETNAFLAIDDVPISPEFDGSYYDSEGDILLFEEFLNDDPSKLPLPPQELKVVEPTTEKSSIDEPPVVELKDLPPHLEYAFLEGDDKLPVVIVKDLKDEEKTALIKVLKSQKQALAWQLFDIKGIDPEFCTHKILIEDDFKPAVQHQRRVNPKIHKVIKKEVLKFLDARLIYPISDSPWVSLVHYVPKKGGFTVVENEENEKTMEVFMDDFSVFGNSFKTCISHLDKMLKRCEDTNLCLNWEKSHFMVKEGIVLGHKISKTRIEVDKAKVDVISKLPHPTTVKGIRSFLGHAGFYRRFIQDFSKIAWPMTRLLEKDTPFFFSQECGPEATKNKAFLTDTLCKQNNDRCQAHYTTTEKELLAVVYAFEKFWPYLVLSKSIIKSSGGVFMARKPLTFSRLATMDPPGDIMAQTTLPKRFGNPRAIFSDRGMHFCNDQFAKVMLKYGVTHRLATAYHPETSGQVTYQRWLSRISKPSPRTNEFEDWVKLSDPKQALHGRQPMLILFVVMNKCCCVEARLFYFSCFVVLYVQEFLDFEDSCLGFCPSITGSSLPQLHLGIKYSNLID